MKCTPFSKQWRPRQDSNSEKALTREKDLQANSANVGKMTDVTSTTTAAKSELETELIQLQISRDRTKDIIASGIKSRIEQQKETLHKLSIAATEEEKSIAAGGDLDEIANWSIEKENIIAKVDEDINTLSSWLSKTERAEIKTSRKQQSQFEELLEQKLWYKELEEKQSTSSQRNNVAKLLKLTITKFNGSHLDWRRFWEQFTVEIDKSGVAEITKFSYLKEFVEPHVRKGIDGLPFTPEGYAKTKTILQDRYGKESEVVKAYVKDSQLAEHRRCKCS